MTMILVFTSTGFTDVRLTFALTLIVTDFGFKWVASFQTVGHKSGPFNPYLIFLFYSL